MRVRTLASSIQFASIVLSFAALTVSPAVAQTRTTPAKTKSVETPKAKTADSPKTKPAAPGRLIDLNKATAEEMVEVLPGVGEVTAKKIVDGRPYGSIDDLAKAGIPARTIEGIRALVTVSTASTSAAKTQTAKKMEPAATAKTAKKAATTASAPAAKVDLNAASADELETLPGIGPAYARQIIALRPIKKLGDLEQIKGLSADKIEELDEHVVILSASPTASTKSATAPAPSAPAVKEKSAAKKVAAKKASALEPGRKIDLNKASADELQLLPGIGPVKSQRIIEGRPFKKVEDVMNVKGIKEGSFAKIKEHIVVD